MEARHWFLVVSLFTLVSCASKNQNHQKVELFFQNYWQEKLMHNPDYANDLSVASAEIDQLTPLTVEHFLAAKKRAEKNLDQIDRLAAITTNHKQKLYLEILKRLMKNEIQEVEYKSYLMPVYSFGGPTNEYIGTSQKFRPQNRQDLDRYILRIKKYKKLKNQLVDLLSLGIKTGFVPPQVIFKGFETSYDRIINTPAHKSRLAEPFDKVDFLDSKEKKRYQARLYQVIEKDFYPAVKNLRQFWVNKYLPNLRKSVSISKVPKGREYYKFLIQKDTTTNLSSEQIHKIGLSEVRRIHKEMNQVIQKVGWKKGFRSFLKFLKTNPQFYAKTKEELLSHVKKTMQRMNKKLPELFVTLPKTPYEIREVPKAIAPKSTTAYYNLPSLDGKKPGIYYVNTYNLKARPLYEVEALSFHESVPGHHLQLAIQMEDKDKPSFLRGHYFNAYTEGWGLYSEVLGKDVGFYQDPYSDFGRLSYEMWRALRLVVDTGLHSQGWSRKKAIEFMVANSALTKANIIAEVDRYIGWPGQALSYKIGQLKILELRKYAKDQLKQKFDIREFHDAILKNGNLPLDLLEREVKAAIDQKMTSSS